MNCFNLHFDTDTENLSFCDGQKLKFLSLFNSEWSGEDSAPPSALAALGQTLKHHKVRSSTRKELKPTGLCKS